MIALGSSRANLSHPLLNATSFLLRSLEIITMAGTEAYAAFRVGDDS